MNLEHPPVAGPPIWNAITDVAGVEVGAMTLNRGSGRLAAGVAAVHAGGRQLLRVHCRIRYPG